MPFILRFLTRERNTDVIKIFDRYLLRIFVRSFIICFTSLVGLYIVIDAFSKIDEFSEQADGVRSLLATMGRYYMYRVSLFFDSLAGVITTMSAMFTFSWIQRTNELMPVLAAGVPTRRVIAPVLIAAMAVSGLATANQELMIPRIARELQQSPDDGSKRSLAAHPARDARGILMSGDRCFRQDHKIAPAFVTLPPTVMPSLVDLRAREAQYVAPGRHDRPTGGWVLRDVQSDNVPTRENVLEQIGPGEYFLHTTITFNQLLRRESWFAYFSTSRLLEEIRQPGNPSLNEMKVTVHGRFIRPLASLTMLFLGLPFVLSGTDRRMISLVGVSMVISIVFQFFSTVCGRLGNMQYLSPELAACLPVIVFGAIAAALYDMVKS